jgi:hypothetical protein
LPITKDRQYGFYWIGAEGDREAARRINETLQAAKSHGVTVIEGEEHRILAVRIGQYQFGEIINE